MLSVLGRFQAHHRACDRQSHHSGPAAFAEPGTAGHAKAGSRDFRGHTLRVAVPRFAVPRFAVPRFASLGFISLGFGSRNDCAPLLIIIRNNQ